MTLTVLKKIDLPVKNSKFFLNILKIKSKELEIFDLFGSIT